MNIGIKDYIIKSINENQLSHAFLVESNNFEETINKIYEAFIETNTIPNAKIENNISTMLINDENNIISQDKIMQLQNYTMTKSQNNKYKIYFIYDALKMNNSSANKLLKTLEEPAENIIAFLITSSANEIIDTIKSRCILFHDKTKEEKKDYADVLNEIHDIDYKNYYKFLLFKKELKKYEKIEIIEILTQYQLDLLSQTNTLLIAKKYKIIDNVLRLIKLNVNLELCLDKMFIEMGKL